MWGWGGRRGGEVNRDQQIILTVVDGSGLGGGAAKEEMEAIVYGSRAV